MAPKQRERTYPLMSRRQVEGLIADGRKIVIINQFVVKVDAWVPYHPGGEKAIQHMVGRDATDEFQAFHSVESQRLAEKYRVGRIEGRWTNFVPPIQGGVFRPLPTASDELQEVLLERENNKKNITTASSAASSRAPSPTFDLPEPGVHQRKGGKVAQRASSASSVSSVEDFGEAKEPSMSFLDVKTMKEVKLDLERYPSLDDAVQDNIVRKYRELHRRLEAEGLFDCNYSSYAIECCRYFLFAAGAFVFLRLGWYVTSAVFLGCLWHQLSFTVHDAAHMGITHNFHIDWIIGIACADYIGGLSVGWWKRNHNVHHIITNDIEHDPDIQHMPFFAISHRFLHSLRSSYYERVMEYDAFAKLMLSIQHYSYYILLLFGRFNLIRLSWEYLILGLGPKRGIARHYRWVEIAGQFFFWYWFGYGLLYRSIDTNWHRFLYFLVASMVTMPLHLQITLSHFAMSTADLGPQESYPQKMLRTTMDVDCPQWLDFFHGGLQFQAIHHLYPRMPRHNLRRAQKLVQEFCDEVDIPYALFGFVDGNKQVIGRLADVARQGRILAECQKALTASGDPLHAH